MGSGIKRLGERREGKGAEWGKDKVGKETRTKVCQMGDVRGARANSR